MHASFSEKKRQDKRNVYTVGRDGWSGYVVKDPFETTLLQYNVHTIDGQVVKLIYLY
jgi:hypothetical protein